MSLSRDDLRKYSSRSTLRGVAMFLSDMVALSVYAFLAVWFQTWWLQLLFSFIAGSVIAIFFVVAHDAAHDALTPHRWLNRWIGRIAFLPSLHPFSLWVKLHNVRHHLWTCLYPKDDVWTPCSMERYRALPWYSRALYRFYRSPAGPLLYYLIEFWFKKFLWPAKKHYGNLKRQYLGDTLLCYAFAIGYISLLVYGAGAGWFGGVPRPWWNSVLFGAVLPFLIWNVWSGLSIYLHHTHPSSVWYDDINEWRDVSRAHTAVHVVTPLIAQKIFHFIMEHSAHHYRPNVPLYNLREAQAQLEHGDTHVVVYRWTPLTHLDICRRCKLYDFRAKRWTDFAGNFTSPPIEERYPELAAGGALKASADDAWSDELVANA